MTGKSMVLVGAVVSKVTVLSVLVEALLLITTTPAGMSTMTVPSVEQGTATL